MYENKLTSDELFDLLMQLLDTTTPYKHEQRIRDLLPQDKDVDEVGNVWVQVGNPEDSKTLFCCHMDTVGMNPEKTDAFYYDGHIYAMSKTSSCLGGDDRCGILCLLALISAKVPGTYLFHIGEEKGTIGAEFVGKTYNMSVYKRAIEFDRRGTTSIITVMMGSNRTCSEDFALALGKQLNDAGTGLEFKPDDTGAFTDVFRYNEEVAEVTNISVGYQSEHSNNEKINADWLINQLIPALYTVKWEELPSVRDPKGNNTIDKWGSQHWNRWEGKDKKQSSSKSGNTNTTGSSGTNNSTSRHNDRKSESKHYGDGHLDHYNQEHGFHDDEVTELDGLSVFDAEDMFDSCQFCSCKDESITDIFFDGVCWSLCDTCQQLLAVMALDKEEQEASEQEKNDQKDNEQEITLEATTPIIAEFEEEEELTDLELEFQDMVLKPIQPTPIISVSGLPTNNNVKTI